MEDEPCEVEQVIRYFLRLEGERPRDAESRRITETARSALDSEILQFGWELDQHYKRTYRDHKAVLHWVYDSQKRNAVSHWILRRGAPIDRLFTCGLDEGMLLDLQDVRGNLQQFSQKHLRNYPSFNRTDEPPSKIATLIGVEQTGPGGFIQLLDGTHRAFGRISKNRRTVDLFLAIQKPGSRFRQTNPSDCRTAI